MSRPKSSTTRHHRPFRRKEFLETGGDSAKDALIGRSVEFIQHLSSRQGHGAEQNATMAVRWETAKVSMRYLRAKSDREVILHLREETRFRKRAPA